MRLLPSTVSELTTVAGALISIALGVTDAWFFHKFDFDQILIGAGLSALLSYNPIGLSRTNPTP